MNKFKPSHVKKAIRGANKDQKATVAKAKKQFQNKVETMRYFSEALFSGYKIEQKTEYHFRINDHIDIWPARGKYHDLKTNERGVVEGSLLKFLDKRFNAKRKVNEIKNAKTVVNIPANLNARQLKEFGRFNPPSETKRLNYIPHMPVKSLDYSPKFKELRRKKERAEMLIYGLTLVILFLVAARFGLLD